MAGKSKEAERENKALAAILKGEEVEKGRQLDIHLKHRKIKVVKQENQN